MIHNKMKSKVPNMSRKGVFTKTFETLSEVANFLSRAKTVSLYDTKELTRRELRILHNKLRSIIVR